MENIAFLLSIICIIIGHIIPWDSSIKNLLFSFHIPLFFILVGFHMEKVSCQGELKKQVKKDFWQLLIPYIIFHAANSLLGISLYGEEIGASLWIEKLLWASGAEVGTHPLVGIIWILNVLFWGKIGFYIMEALIQGHLRGIVYIICACVSYMLARQEKWLILSLDIVPLVIFYLYIGSQLHKILEYLKKYQTLMIAFALGIWIFLLNEGLYMDLAARHYPKLPFVILQSLCGSYCVIIFIKKMEQWYLRYTDIAGKIGKYAVFILGMHHLSWRVPVLWGRGIFLNSFYNVIVSFLGVALILIIKKWFESSYERWERIFLFIVSVYLIRVFFDTTLFSLAWPWYFDSLLRIAAAILVGIKFICFGCKRDVRLLLGIGTGIIFMLSSFSNRYIFLWDAAVFILGAMDIPYKKILKIYCILGCAIFGLAILGALTGCVRDLVYTNGRHSFGIVYPTDFAAHVVFLALSIWVVFRKIPATVMAVIMAGLSFFLYRYCIARCGAIVMGLSAVAVLYIEQTEPWKREKGILQWFTKWVDRLLIIWMPLCSSIIIDLSMKYDKENSKLETINKLISSRLYLANKAISEYGIKAFGTAFDLIGGGGDTVSRITYNFVDSSYCMILLRYGAMVLAIVCILSIWTASNAVKSKNRRLLMALALISVHSMIEHHLLELAYNPFLLVAFSDLSHDRDCESKQKTIKKETWQTLSVYTAIGVIGLIAMPRLLGYFRTIVTLQRLNDRTRYVLFIFGALGISFISIALIKRTTALIVKRLNQTSIDKKELTSCCQYVILLFFVVASMERTLQKQSISFEESLEKGTQIIKELRKEEDSNLKICIDDIPELYERAVGNIENPILTGAGLAKETDIVLFTDKSKDIYLLTDKDFMFGELSQQQGIYTNSEKAIKIMEEQGIKLTDHYSIRREVDLQSMADANGLQQNEQGSLLIEGPEKSLIHGPWLTIYKGTLRIEYQLKLVDTQVESGEIATLRLSAESGQTILQEKPLNKEDFNENGVCTVAIDQSINSKEGLEFLLFAKDGTKLEVERISYGKIGR